MKAFSTDTGATKVMVLPLKINAPKEQEYLKGSRNGHAFFEVGRQGRGRALSAGVAANAAIELGEHPGR